MSPIYCADLRGPPLPVSDTDEITYGGRVFIGPSLSNPPKIKPRGC